MSAVLFLRFEWDCWRASRISVNKPASSSNGGGMEVGGGLPESAPKKKIESVKDIQEIYGKLNSLDRQAILDVISSLEEQINSHASNGKRSSGVMEDRLLFQAYFRALDIAGNTDVDVLRLFEAAHVDLRAHLLYGVLFTKFLKRVDLRELERMCQSVCDQAPTSTTHFLLATLQSANLLYLKYPAARLRFSLTMFYTCLQSQSTAIRDDCVVLFKNWITREGNAERIFRTIVNYWPWTNKYKYILLSAILAERKLQSLVSDEADVEVFLSGLRHSLSYKSLFSAGQFAVKALSRQNLPAFDQLLARILMAGSHVELVNLHSQWMHYIENKSELCAQIGFDQTTLDSILQLDFVADDGFRLVLICTIFEKQVLSGPHSNAIVAYLQNNCLGFSRDAQLYAYKLLASNMPAAGDLLAERLAFLVDFVKKHLFVPCPEFRNTVLGKLPLVLDCLSKKLKCSDASVIVNFFAGLKEIFQFGISRREYQPLVFTLRLFEILLRCLESSTHKSLMKNSHVSLHRTLSKILVEHRVWVFNDEYQTIVKLLSDCGDYDDVRELIVKILMQMESSCDPEMECELWKKYVEDSSIEKCALSQYYARIYVNRRRADAALVAFFEYSTEKIMLKTKDLKLDALQACKQGGHVFGFYMALSALFSSDNCNERMDNLRKKTALELAEQAVVFVLSQLNLAGSDETNASFQTIEESLEMLVADSSWPSEVHSVDRKFLLLSFWLTLKACCELATSIGLTLVESAETDDQSRALLRRCLGVQSKISHGCRHKGAIEAAGSALGQLVRGISRNNRDGSETYNILYDCFDVLFGSVNNISTTRRGAGLSIMFQHFIKNDAQRSRPLFQHAIKILLEHAKKSRSPTHHIKDSDECHDNFDALVMHYLCVLVRDSELKDSISEYYDDIMMSAIARINDKEWTVRNGALQLFGALVPKIVGQKQAVVGDNEEIDWHPSEITFTEYCIKLPKTNAYILDYCKGRNQSRKSTSSIILFLEFLSSIDYMRKEEVDTHFNLLHEYRELFWQFLSHSNEKVRKISSKCLVRLHDFREELPDLALTTIDIIFESEIENFTHGMILFCIHAMQKLKVESQFVSHYSFDSFCNDFQARFRHSYKSKSYSFYVKRYLLELIALAKFHVEDEILEEILSVSDIDIDMKLTADRTSAKYYVNFGLDAFLDKLTDFKEAINSKNC